MSLDNETAITTANENCTVVQVDVHDTASPAGEAGEKQTRKGKTAEKHSSSTSSITKLAGGKSSKSLHDTVRCCR